MSNVFIIINAWATDDGVEVSEVCDGRYFESEQEAWIALRDIAHAYSDDLDYDATSISFDEPAKGIQYEEYYIQELTHG